MKKIIDGKLYNTETATEIISIEANCFPGDFRYWSETVYKTKKGQYFIYGHGGPLSHYAESFGNSKTGSEALWLISENEVKKIVMENDVELALEMFPDSIDEG